MIKIILLILTLLPSVSSAASTWYVRTDGGTSTQCTGLADAAYSGSGSAQTCSFNHPFWALPPGRTPVIQGGDSLIISSGSYMMGAGAPNGLQGSSGGSDACNNNWTYECVAPEIPSGTDAAHPTRILGKNWDTKSTPAPELWGSGKAKWLLSLKNSNYVEVQYLELTDHSNCITNSVDPAKKCASAYPWGDFAQAGIFAYSSHDVLLKNLDIHGFSVMAMQAGALTDWTLDGVVMHANGIKGWEGDVSSYGVSSINTGTINILNSRIDYNGCAENYPSTNLWGCHGQGQQGAGDGIASDNTGGSWVIINSEISHNLQDGLDLLYHGGPSLGSVTIKRSRFEGNAGNQVKVSTNAEIDNSVIIGNCDFFENNPMSESYSGSVEVCRADGTPVFFNGWGSTSNRPPYLTPGTSQVTITNSIVGGTSRFAFGLKGGTCTGSEAGLVSRNNIFLGHEPWYDYRYGSPGAVPTLVYWGGSDGDGAGPCGSGATKTVFDNRDSIAYNFNPSQCPNANNVLCTDPLLTAVPPSTYAASNAMYTYGDRWDVSPATGSPALNKSSTLKGATVYGSITVPTSDILGTARGASTISWGPYEVANTGSGGASDTTPPTTTADKSGRYTASQTVTLSTDETATIKYCLTASCTPITTYSAPFKVLQNIATQTLRYQATDTVGNVEAVKENVLRKQRKK